jgi:hypothetical protein
MLPAPRRASLRDGDSHGAGGIQFDTDIDSADDLPLVPRLFDGTLQTVSCIGWICGEPAGAAGAGALVSC